MNDDRDPRRIPFRAMIPNAVTALALCFGLTGVSLAIGNHWEKALGSVILAGVLDGLDHLAADQWMNVWPRIRDFTFRLDEVRAGCADGLLWAACPWDSRGTRPDGTTFERPGRATVILVHDGERWRAAHTHFSLYPAQ